MRKASKRSKARAIARSKEELVWICKDGEALKIKDMTDSHLKNSISYLEKNPNWRKKFLPKLRAEQRHRQDRAVSSGKAKAEYEELNGLFTIREV